MNYLIFSNLKHLPSELSSEKFSGADPFWRRVLGLFVFDYWLELKCKSTVEVTVNRIGDFVIVQN